MSLPLNKYVLEGAYRYLRSTRPFCYWNLPEGEDVVFRVLRTDRRHGHYRWFGSKHTIAVSGKTHGRTLALMETMAHEMVHLYIELHKFKDKSEHGPVFRHFAGQVCKYHGFDPKLF